MQATVAARGWGNLISQGTLNRTVDALADHDPSALRGARFGKDPMGMVLSNALAKNILVEDDRGGGATEGRAIHAKLKPIVDMMNGISCGGDVGSYKTSTTGKSVPDQLNQILDEHFFHAANFSQPLNIIITTNFQLDKKQKGQVKDALLAAKNFGHGEQAVQLRIIQTGTPGTKEYKNAKAASDGLDDGEKKFGIKESSKKSVKDMVDATAADRSVEAGDVSKLASYTAEDHLAKMIAVDPRADKKG